MVDFKEPYLQLSKDQHSDIYSCQSMKKTDIWKASKWKSKLFSQTHLYRPFIPFPEFSVGFSYYLIIKYNGWVNY